MKQTRVQRVVRPARRDAVDPDANPTAPASDTSGAAALLRRIERLVSGR